MSDTPAFPLQIENRDQHEGSSPGMTLRQWYAGMGLTGLMSDSGLRPATTEEFEHMAMRLFQVADAMIAEDKKRETG